jgi:hypothetical protein
VNNGERIIPIGRKGFRLFALGDGEPKKVDVVAVHGQWADIDAAFRDKEGNIPPDQVAAARQAAWAFARDVLEAPDISLAEAYEFLKLLTDEVNELQDFFVPKSRDGQSSREPTTVRFST